MREPAVTVVTHLLALRLLSAEIKRELEILAKNYPSADIHWHRGQEEVCMDLWNGWVRSSANPQSNKIEQNCQKQQFKDSGNWPKEYNKLRRVYQENLLKLNESSRSLWHFAWSSSPHPPTPSSSAQKFYWGSHTKRQAALLPEGTDFIWRIA